MKNKNIQEKFQISDTFWAAAFMTLSGGFQDAYTYFLRGNVFCFAQTTNTLFLAEKFIHQEWSGMIHYLIPVICFLLGTCCAQLIRLCLHHRPGYHWRQTVLLMQMVLILPVPFIHTDVIANVFMTFAGALQFFAFRKVKNLFYTSMGCSGSVRGAAQALADFQDTRDRKHLKIFWNYSKITLYFFAGAAIGVLCGKGFGLYSIWIVEIFLLLSFLAMTRQKSSELSS